MAGPSVEDRVAILLNLLGEEAVAPALARISPERAINLRGKLDILREEPPANDDIDEVLEEFESFLRFAKQTAPNEPPELAIAEEPDDEEPEAEDEDVPEPFAPTDDPIFDINRLAPTQIAGALESELTRTVAMVVSALESDLAAQTLALLPEETRSAVFVQLNHGGSGPHELLCRIVRTTVTRAAAIDPGDAEKPDTDQRMADVLRAMNKKTRAQMLEVLDEQEPESAARIKGLLYVFDDLMLIDNRSLQKLLAEIDSDTLTRALKGSDDALIEKVLGNLSKRARDNLMEEMEYLGSLDEDTVEQSRKAVTEVIARLDQAGELVMES